MPADSSTSIVGSSALVLIRAPSEARAAADADDASLSAQCLSRLTQSARNFRASLDGTTAIFARTSDFITLDWQTTGSAVALPYLLPAYDRLVAFSQNGRKVVPYLATSWKITPKGRPRQIVFHVRKDAKC